MIRKENLIMTFAGGDHNFFRNPTFWVWVNSVKNIPNSDPVILTNQMPEDVKDRLLGSDIEVVDVTSGITHGELHHIYRDRHLCFWEYLNDHGHKYKYVCVCDCRDVVFQANPFEWIEDWKDRHASIGGNKRFLNDFVIMTAEGHKMSQSGFSCIEHFEFERDIPRPFLKDDRNRFVVNGGVFVGSSRAIQDWHFLIWMTQLKTMGTCTDQATVNWLLYYLDKDDKYSISFPQTDHLCLTGEGIKEGAVEPILKDGILLNPNGKPYCLIHQWDRIDHLREAIFTKYA
jgi:hypothetical protein